MNSTTVFNISSVYYFLYNISHTQGIPGIYIILILFLYHFLVYVFKGYVEKYKNNIHAKRINQLIIERDSVNPELDFPKYIELDKKLQALKKQPQYQFPTLFSFLLSVFPSILFYHVQVCFFDQNFCYPFKQKTIYLPWVSYIIRSLGSIVFPLIIHFPNSGSSSFIGKSIFNYVQYIFPTLMKIANQ